MMKLKVVVVVLSLVMVVSGEDGKMPPDFVVCSRSAPSQERNACLKQTMTQLLATMKNGYPPLNINSLDPYHLGVAQFQYSAGALATRVNLKDAVSHGASNVQIKNVRSRVNDQNLNIEMDVHFPKLITEADFKGRSVFNQVKVRSEGHVKLNMYDVTCTFKIIGKAKSDDPKYMKITSFDMTDIKIKRLKMDGTGFVPDPDVNQLVLEFVNQNWRQFYNDILNNTKSVWEPLFLEMLNKIFEHVPFDQIMSK